MISGNIYLRVTHPLDGKHLEIKVEGKEKGAWTDEVFEKEGEEYVKK